jgi:hypothetical protein
MPLTEQDKAERAARRKEVERRLALPLEQRDRIYRVQEYAAQRARHPHRTPRGICSKCLTNYTMRSDNTMIRHRPGGKVCGGSELPSLGLPRGWHAY